MERPAHEPRRLEKLVYGIVIVYLGGGSSKLNKHQFSELIEMIWAFGAEQGVEWSGQSHEAIEYARAK